MFLGPQTLKTWHMDKKTGLETGEDEIPAGIIPDNGLMGLYPSTLNPSALNAFYARVPRAMKLRHGLFVGSSQHVADWTQKCMHQACASIDAFLWSGATYIQQTHSLQMGEWSLKVGDPWGVVEPFSEKKLMEKNTDLGWLCSETGYPIDVNGDYFTQMDWAEAYESELIDISAGSPTAHLNWATLVHAEQGGKRTRNEKETEKEEEEEDEKGTEGTTMTYPIGVFDPHHKATNDAALSQVVMRKFVSDKGMTDIEVKEVEKMLDDFLKNHKDEVKAKTHLAFKKLFVFSDWYGGITPDVVNLYMRVKDVGFFGKTNTLKEELNTKYGHRIRVHKDEDDDDEEHDGDDTNKKKKHEEDDGDDTNKKKKPKKGKEKEDVDPPVPDKTIKQVAIDAVNRVVENVVEPAVARMMKRADAKDLVTKSVKELQTAMETSMNKIAAEVVAKVKAPPPPVAAADGQAEKNTKNVGDIVKNTVSSTVAAMGELQKEKARTQAMRLTLVQYMNTEADARFIVAQMKRTAPDGTALFTDKEIEEDVNTAWRLSQDDKAAVLTAVGIKSS